MAHCLSSNIRGVIVGLQCQHKLLEVLQCTRATSLTSPHTHIHIHTSVLTGLWTTKRYDVLTHQQTHNHRSRAIGREIALTTMVHPELFMTNWQLKASQDSTKYLWMVTIEVNPSRVKGKMGSYGLGGACDHIKAFWTTPIYNVRVYTPTSK